jgi:hypothetical protein
MAGWPRELFFRMNISTVHDALRKVFFFIKNISQKTYLKSFCVDGYFALFLLISGSLEPPPPFSFGGAALLKKGREIL